MPDDDVLSFTVLGPVRGWRGGTELALGGPQQRTALAILLLSGARPVDIDELVHGMWGENPPRTAVGAARTYVSRLRAELEPEHRYGSGPRLLVSVGTSYVLRRPVGTLDIELVERDMAEAAAARKAGNLDQARELLGRAERRWQGTPLTGVTGPHSDDARERLLQRRLELMEQRIELDLEVGEAAAAIADLTRLTAEHPLRESLRALQMRALYQCGRQAEALSAFADTRHVLAEELGIDPGPRLRDLQERILRSDPALLQERRPAPAPAPSPRQLPSDTADFTGRADLVASCAELLIADGPIAPVCAVSGIGGAGKTAFAVHVAHAVRGHFPDGQLYVDLGGASDRPLSPHEVLGHFLRSLGVEKTGVPDDQGGRAGLYRSMLADRRLLIVLDNARDAAQAGPLLPGYPGCATIITSRPRLSTARTASVELDAFQPAEAMRLLIAVVGEDRVLAEPTAARELLAACGHLPLAVRVVAGRLLARPGSTISAVAHRLSDQRGRLSRLHSDDLDVQATFRLGYDQLDPPLARAFRLLSLPDAETVPLAAAAALLDLDADDAEDELDRLIDSGLVQLPESGRYRLHDLVRLFARDRGAEQDEPADAAAAISRLLDFLLATTRNAYLLVRPGNRMADLLRSTADRGVRFDEAGDADAWFGREREFVLGVLRQAVDRWPELIDTISDVLLGLDPLLERSFAWRQSIVLARLIAAAAHRAGRPHAEAAARYMLGGALWQVSELAEAEEQIALAIERAAQGGDPLLLGEVMTVQGLIAGHAGRTDEAIDLLRATLGRQRETGNRSGQANNLGNLAYLYGIADRQQEALDASAAAVSLYRELGDRMGETHALHHHGPTLARLGRYDEAARCYDEALALSRRHGLRYLEGPLLSQIARLHLRRGDMTSAAAAAEQTISVATELGSTLYQAKALVMLSHALRALGQTDRAEACRHAAAELLERLGESGADNVRRLVEELDGMAMVRPIP